MNRPTRHAVTKVVIRSAPLRGPFAKLTGPDLEYIRQRLGDRVATLKAAAGVVAAPVERPKSIDTQR